jgi:hypothetical protein
MARIAHTPVGETKQFQRDMGSQSIQEETLAEARLNLGMITSLDPGDIPQGALQLCKNARVRFDRTSRRPGGTLLTPTKPNSQSIVGLSYFKQSDGDEFFFRATRNTIHHRSGGSWVDIPADVTTLVGNDNDYFQFVAALNRIFFVNNGKNPIQEIDLTVPEYKVANVSEAAVKTEYKYLTAFYNRLVGANKQGSVIDPTQIGWSGDANLTEFDPSVDETAGSGPLIESPGDLADFITGIFGFTNIMLVLRELSIWIATKNPIATNPFNFYAAFPGVGCDCPYSAAVALNNLVWLDTRTKTVWAYPPNGQPEPIGRNVEKDILRAVDEKDRVFGGYDSDENEYSIGIPLAGAGITRIWTFNFRTKAWSYDEMEAVSRIVDIPFAEAGLIIDDLPGQINQLVGQINDLSPQDASEYFRMYGRTDGEIVLEDINVYRDPPVVGSPAVDSGSYETDLWSKEFELEEIDAYFSRVTIKLKPFASGTVRLEVSRDEKPFEVMKSKTFISTDIGRSVLLMKKKMIHCRRMKWRLVATDGYFDVEGYEIKIYPSGTHRK